MGGGRKEEERARTGIVGLDDILVGGLSRGHVFLVEGEPGTGKTTLALQFLLEGEKADEPTLYVTLSETEEELRQSAASHGWTLGRGISVFELSPPETLLDPAQQQTLLYSSDLELGETTKRIFSIIDRAKPKRAVLDSLSEIRLLAQSSLRYRRQVLALKHHLSRLGCTVLMLDDLTAEPGDRTMHSIAHGVIRLEELAPVFGAERRRLRVTKYRGSRFRGGFHDFTIRKGGLDVFPRLVSAEHHRPQKRRRVPSGVAELDTLLGGGADSGTSTLIIGPAGTGKSLTALTFAKAAMERGEKVAMFGFDEEMGLLFSRTKALGFDLEGQQEEGRFVIDQIDTAELSPGEFAHRVHRIVDRAGIGHVVIDSLNGYRHATAEEGSLILHLHELLQFLNHTGVSTFMTVAQHGILGDETSTPVDITYLADTVIVLRYFEAGGSVRRAMSVTKKRSGNHEKTIREFSIGGKGLSLGPPLTHFHGVLLGVPTFTGAATGGEWVGDR